MENVSNNESDTIQLTKELIKISSKKRLKNDIFQKCKHKTADLSKDKKIGEFIRNIKVSLNDMDLSFDFLIDLPKSRITDIEIGKEIPKEVYEFNEKFVSHGNIYIAQGLGKYKPYYRLPHPDSTQFLCIYIACDGTGIVTNTEIIPRRIINEDNYLRQRMQELMN